MTIQPALWALYRLSDVAVVIPSTSGRAFVAIARNDAGIKARALSAEDLKGELLELTCLRARAGAAGRLSFRRHDDGRHGDRRRCGRAAHRPRRGERDRAEEVRFTAVFAVGQ
jgi:hypothetical protein